MSDNHHHHREQQSTVAASSGSNESSERVRVTTPFSDSLSLKVAELFQPALTTLRPKNDGGGHGDDDDENEKDKTTKTSSLWIRNKTSSKGHDIDESNSINCYFPSTHQIPRLRLDDGPLSPRELLKGLMKQQVQHPPYANNNDPASTYDDHKILRLLNDKPDDDMKIACYNLHKAAKIAMNDVLSLSPTVADNTTTTATSRIQLSLQLLQDAAKLMSSSSSSSATTASLKLLSATQLLLSELDWTLERLMVERMIASSQSTNVEDNDDDDARSHNTDDDDNGGPDDAQQQQQQQQLGKWRIRDLLTQLRSTLGLPLSLVLHLFVGPLNGICLRNLIWHGYIGVNELRRPITTITTTTNDDDGGGGEGDGGGSHYWPYLLWVVVVELSTRLTLLRRQRTTVVSPMSQPQPNDLTVTTSQKVPIMSTSKQQRCIMTTTPPPIPAEQSIQRLVDTSPPFLPPSMRPVFCVAIRLCRDYFNNHHDNDNGEDAVLLWRSLSYYYIILERGLRVLYARTNPTLFTTTVKEATTSSSLSSESVPVPAQDSSEHNNNNNNNGNDSNGDPITKVNPCLARTDVLHVTMAKILRIALPVNEYSNSSTPSSSVAAATRKVTNGLHPFLGGEEGSGGAMDALYDEFVWMGLPDVSEDTDHVIEPVPCRNELVHGVLSVHDISPQIVIRMMKLTIGLTMMSQRLFDDIDHKAIIVTPKTLQREYDDEDDDDQDSAISTCVDWLQSYKARRHPICQIWCQFRTVVHGRGDSDRDYILQRSRMLSDLLPQSSIDTTTTTTTKVAAAVANDEAQPNPAVLVPRHVEYCKVCNLPFEYCCYTKSPMDCLEYRYGSLSNVSLFETIQLICDFLQVLPKQTEKKKKNEIQHKDEHMLISELQKRRIQLTRIIVNKTTTSFENNQLSNLDFPNDDSTGLWNILHCPPMRRGSSEDELNKLWNIRECLQHSRNVITSIYRRLCGVVVDVACGNKRGVGRKKEPFESIVQKLQVSALTIEIVLLLVLDQYFAPSSTSVIVPSFLSVFANTLLSQLEQGNLQFCVGMCSEFAMTGIRFDGDGEGGSKNDDFQTPESTPLTDVLNRLKTCLPRRDRGKFAFDIDRYIDRRSITTKIAESDDSDLILNKFILGIDRVKFTSSAWESLRRWQSVSDL